MAGKQNYKNNKIFTNYTQNIFCFDVFCAFEFFSGAENFDFLRYSYRESETTKLLKPKFSAPEKNPKSPKHQNKKCFENVFYNFWFPG